MQSIIVFLTCLGSAIAQWGQPHVYYPQHPNTGGNNPGLPASWTSHILNNGPVAKSSQNTWSVGSQVLQSSPPVASTTSESQAYGGTTDTPYTTTTEWTTEGEPSDVSLDGKVEAKEISTPHGVPGSEMKDALPGNKYEKALLDEINNYRLMHGSAQLRINADLDKKAKLWAQKMALEDRESLDVNSQYGQLTFSGPSEITPSVPVAAARHWYNRIKNYAWDKPGISTKSTQFTQLVWSTSQQIGVGIAENKSGLKSYVAALFSPRGNIKNKVTENVLPVTGTGAGKRGADSCPKGWHKFKKSCYRFFNNDVKWAEAVNLCDDEHSSLASLGSPEEETSVRSMLAKDEGTEAWIGLSDRVHLDNKDLIWVDGNPMPYSNWNSYQDDVIEGRKCATLSIATEGWMYKACQETFGFICKKRLKDIMTYLVVLSYPEKLWSDNLRTEVSPRYMAMKKHLDHAIMNLYDDDDWFVDMLFDGFSQSPDDKVTAEFKLRFSPDGDAPSDPLEKLRTKLESDGLVQGEKIFLQHVSLQNGDPDSCPSNCLNTRISCSSPNCPVYCCNIFPTKRKYTIPPQQQLLIKNIPRLSWNNHFFGHTKQGANIGNLKWGQSNQNLMYKPNGYGLGTSNYFGKVFAGKTAYLHKGSFSPLDYHHKIAMHEPAYQELQDEMNKFQYGNVQRQPGYNNQPITQPKVNYRQHNSQQWLRLKQQRRPQQQQQLQAMLQQQKQQQQQAMQKQQQQQAMQKQQQQAMQKQQQQQAMQKQQQAMQKQQQLQQQRQQPQQQQQLQTKLQQQQQAVQQQQHEQQQPQAMQQQQQQQLQQQRQQQRPQQQLQNMLQQQQTMQQEKQQQQQQQQQQLQQQRQQQRVQWQQKQQQIQQYQMQQQQQHQQQQQKFFNYNPPTFLRPLLQKYNNYSPNFIPKYGRNHQRDKLKRHRYKNNRHSKQTTCPGNCPPVCAPSCIKGCCRLKR